MIHLAPIIFPCLGKGPIKSIAQVSKVRLGLIGRRGISFFWSGRPILWWASHWAIFYLQSLLIEVYHILDWRIFLMVMSTEKWPPVSPECASCIMSCLSCSRAHRWRMSSKPYLYKFPLISVKGATLIVNIFFFFSEYWSGDFPSCKYRPISANSDGIASTLNKCASGRSSSIPVKSSPDSTLDKWSGLTFGLPSQIITSNLNSWCKFFHDVMTCLLGIPGIDDLYRIWMGLLKGSV